MGLEHKVESVEQLAVVLDNHACATDPGTAAAAAPQQLELLTQQAVTPTPVTVVMMAERLPAALARLSAVLARLPAVLAQLPAVVAQLALLMSLSLLEQQARTTAAAVVMLEMVVWGRLATSSAALSVDLQPSDSVVQASLVGCFFVPQMQVWENQAANAGRSLKLPGVAQGLLMTSEGAWMRLT